MSKGSEPKKTKSKKGKKEPSATPKKVVDKTEEGKDKPSATPEKVVDKTEEGKEKPSTTLEETVALLTNIPGVGPKTAEKLAAAGYDTLEKVATADKEELAAAVAGLSVSKAEATIVETEDVLEKVKSGALDLSGKSKAKRKKAPEPDPDIHELDPMEAIDKAEERKKLVTGYDKEKEAMGIPIGPKWLTRFEKARIIGARALQVSMGAPVLIDIKTAPKGRFGFAEAELKSGALPMTVRRTKPTGETFDIALSTLLKHTRLD
ncbi:MAG: DNA-directed RNA polymerase subunit K [Candidatus Thorarchaeota archaeon]|jgi:DNA-directed RNA polymerase subunit K/omega/predicted flap endonuclease-1-like 5' DNA nuclease